MNESALSSNTKYKKILFAGLAIIAVLLILALTRNNSFLSQLPKKVVPSGHTTLSLSPTVLNDTQSPATLDVLIDSGGDPITAVQLDIAYDPATITDLSIQSGDFLGESQILPLNSQNENSGKATFVITPKNIQEAKSGKGVLAKLIFYPKKAGNQLSTTISILDTSLVSARGISTSVLKKVGSATITLPQ
ncbi:MAG: cohesin domain-containing protein [Patescibacteria group bacterium]